MERDTDADDGSSIDVAGTKAHVAVALLANSAGPDKYNERDVAEAVDHLHAASEAAPAGTDTAERVAAALELLADVDERPIDSVRKRHLCVQDALVELAPVAAGVTDRDPRTAASRARPAREDFDPLLADEKLAVPVFFHVSPEVADRAIHRFERLRVADAGPKRRTPLRDYIYDEIDEQPVIYVGGEPLAEYAAGRVETLVIEPGDEGE